MTTAQKIVVAIIAAVGFVAIGITISMRVDAPVAGGVNAYNAGVWQFGNGSQGGLVVGNGTQLTQVLKGTCTLIGAAGSQGASSTVPYDCAVTGVQSGDLVFASLASSTLQIVGGWDIVGAKASTTAGYITVLLQNQTGGAANPSVSAVGSSTQYLIVR